MLQNLNNVNLQMQQLADNAVTAAKDKFGVSLDFTEKSLQQLEILLQQAHEGYKQTSSSGNTPNIPIENTLRVWGSYLGEVIRRYLGGDWVVDQKDVFLQLNSQRLDPLGEVRSRIMIGTKNNLQEYYGKLSNIQKQIPSQPANESLAQEAIGENDTIQQFIGNLENKCPYCGREFQGRNVTFCPLCGKLLGEVSSQGPFQIASKIGRLEGELSTLESKLRSDERKIESSKGINTLGGVGVLVGLALFLFVSIPVGIFIIVVSVLVAILGGGIFSSRRQNAAQADLSATEKKIAFTRSTLAELRARPYEKESNRPEQEIRKRNVEQILAQAKAAYEKGENLKTVLSICESALSIAPDFAEAHFLKGIVLEDLRELDDAIIAFNNALKFDPTLKSEVDSSIHKIEELRKKWTVRY